MSECHRIARTIFTLLWRGSQTRIRRTLARLQSPTRLLATLAATLFLLLYVVNGVLIVLTRKAADPAALTIWLGGAMAVCALFHFVRAAWQETDSRLGLSPAESLWMARAPIADRYLVWYRIASILPATFIKSLLVAVVMFCDVASPVRLVIALFLAMTMLEAIRMTADRFAAALSPAGRIAMRIAATGIAIAISTQLLARTVTAAAGSVHPLALLNAFTQAAGATASSSMIQWLAVPWRPMLLLALENQWNSASLIQLMVSILFTFAAVMVVIAVDRWASWHQHRVETARLDQRRCGSLKIDGHRGKQVRKTLLSLPRLYGVGPLLSRQWVGVVRYRGTILVSLAVPAALSLSPLMTDAEAGLLPVAAWLAVSTLLLAPPALRIDFRRDIDRVWLLKALPITPLTMTVGQLILPSLLTIAFQVLVVTIACFLAPTTPATVLLVIGGLSGFAVLSFAMENTLFLTFPHRVKQEGLAMMVRAKLVFLGKGLLLTLVGAAFIAWVTLCGKLGWPLFVLVAGCVAASWLSAIATVAVTARCWRRFVAI